VVRELQRGLVLSTKEPSVIVIPLQYMSGNTRLKDN
jgi:hypothetical protein